jgi:hypothetical protein
MLTSTSLRPGVLMLLELAVPGRVDELESISLKMGAFDGLRLVGEPKGAS